MRRGSPRLKQPWLMGLLLALLTLSGGLFARQDAQTEAGEKVVPRPPVLQLQVRLSPKESLFYWWTVDVQGDQLLVAPKPWDLSKPSPQPPRVDLHQYKELYLWLYHSSRNLLFRWKWDLQKSSPSVQVKENDFNILPLLKLHLITQGKPLASGWIVLEDQQGLRHPALLLPSARGDLLLSRVALGRAEVEVRYGEDRTARLEVDVVPGKAGQIPSIEIPVVGGPALEAQAPSAQEAVTPPKPSPAAPLSPFLSFLISLGLVAVLGLVLYSLVRFRIIKVDRLLKRLGVPESPPSPSDFLRKEPEPVAVASGHCPFCGQAKDPVTGACACSPPEREEEIPRETPLGLARLVGIAGPALNRQFLLNRPEVIIGRDPSSDIPLVDDPTVSRRHCKISIRGEEILLQDEGSSNGTFVNGARVTNILLRPGDEIVIGQSRFRLEG